MSTLKDVLIFNILNAETMPLVDAVNFLLSLQRKPISQIAKEAGVSRQMVYYVLSGKKSSPKVKKAISDALGFNPWA